MLRVLSYNIRLGGTGREKQLAGIIRSAAADVIVLQEATRPDVVRRLAEATEMPHWGSLPRHSVAFMSRLEIAKHEWHRPRPCYHAFLELVLAGRDVRIYGIHLSAVHSNWTERRRTREIKATLAAIAEHAQGIHAMVGDFNTLAPREAFSLKLLPLRLRIVAWLGGSVIRHQTVQLMLDAGYVDGFRSLHSDQKGFTFPTWDPHVRIDYAFIAAAAAKRLRRCEVVNGPETRAASDHLPLLVELEV